MIGLISLLLQATVESAYNSSLGALVSHCSRNKRDEMTSSDERHFLFSLLPGFGTVIDGAAIKGVH